MIGAFNAFVRVTVLFDGTNHKKINLYDIRVREIHFNQLNYLRQLFCHYQADKILQTG